MMRAVKGNDNDISLNAWLELVLFFQSGLHDPVAVEAEVGLLCRQMKRRGLILKLVYEVHP